MLPGALVISSGKRSKYCQIRPQDYYKKNMLNSAEHEISPAHKLVISSGKRSKYCQIRLQVYYKKPCSTQLSMKFLVFINCWHNFTIYEQENSIIDLPEPEKAEFLDIFLLVSI